MPEKIVNLLNAITAVKGKEYAEGLVDMANLLAPRKPEGKEDSRAEADADSKGNR